jgi:hypothetical protein
MDSTIGPVPGGVWQVIRVSHKGYEEHVKTHAGWYIGKEEAALWVAEANALAQEHNTGDTYRADLVGTGLDPE